MREKPKQPKTAIIVVSVITGILVIVGLGLVYMITRQKSEETSSTGGSKCCFCSWTTEEGTEVAKALGYSSNGTCSFAKSVNVNGESISGCSDITLPNDSVLTANSQENPCDVGCAGFSSNPIIPPTVMTESNQEVDFYATFKLYKINEDDRYTVAQMEFEYPDENQSPPPLQVNISEDSDKVEIVESEENNITVETYKITFSTSWNTILDQENPGFYKVSFTAKNQDNEWTKAANNTRIIEVSDELNTGYYCSSIDIAQPGNTGSQNVTIEAIKSNDLPQDQIDYYKWSLDLDCNGSVNSSDEIFETEENSISKEFTYPDNATQSVSCPASVEIYLEDGTLIPDQTASSCSSQITLSAEESTCGNGVCDPGETCDTGSNLTCPGSENLPDGATCRIDCTYCGDGVLNAEEECDPAIQIGTLGYNENCSSECTIIETPDQNDDQNQDDPTDNSSTTSTTTSTTISTTTSTTIVDPGKDQSNQNAVSVSINYVAPSCLEISAPNNVGTLYITVNNGTSLPQVVSGVSESLPTGFNYNTGSSVINGNANINDTGVIIESSGNSQLISFDNSGSGWTIPAQGSLSINLNATVGSTTTGVQNSTVVVALLNSNPISASASTTVAETCEQPDTGLFDSNSIIIISGSILLVLSTAIYSTGISKLNRLNVTSNKAQRSKSLIKGDKKIIKSQKQIVANAEKMIEDHRNKPKR